MINMVANGRGFLKSGVEGRHLSVFCELGSYHAQRAQAQLYGPVVGLQQAQSCTLKVPGEGTLHRVRPRLMIS